MTRTEKSQRRAPRLDASPSAGPARDESPRTPLAHLTPALRRLDQVLTVAIAEAELRYGETACGDLLRGLRLSHDDVARLLSREPCELLYGSVAGSARAELTAGDEASPLSRLGAEYELSELERAVVLIAIAPELDLRYERVFAFLQDDVTRRRPSVDLVLSVLCPTADEKVAQRRLFAGDAPLVRHGIVRLVSDGRVGLLSQMVRLDEQVIRHLVGEDTLDARLVPSCRVFRRPADAGSTPGDAARRLRLHVRTPDRETARRVAFENCHFGFDRLIEANLALVSADRDEADSYFSVLLREARLRRLTVHVTADVADGSGARSIERLLAAAQSHPGPIILSNSGESDVKNAGQYGVSSRSLPWPNAAERAAAWRTALARSAVHVSPERITTLARRYRLALGQIADAAILVAAAPSSRGSRASAIASLAIDDSDVRGAIRAVCGSTLEEVAQRVEGAATWDDLVLPPDALRQLHELCARVENRERVLADWGFGDVLTRGTGSAALFAGASGTGKTMAAEVVARALGLDLYRVDLARVVSKYIGETEKNLDRVFTAASHGNAVLLFDEADALFGKRSEVSDAHDRYANIEISYLLQRIEAYDGVAILATNLAEHLDDAFTRRLAFTIHFPFPDETARRALWVRAWPPGVPVSPSLDRSVLARELRLTGGNIRNVALAAAYHAASDGGVVTETHIRHAVLREMQKMGQSAGVSA